MPDTSGWPFLVAAGRHRDYSTLLAPDFLVAALDFGFLDELAPTSDRPAVVVVRTRAGRPLTVAYATRVVTSADLDPAAASAPVTDEVGRPLRLIYGFVTHQAVVALAEEDLASAFDVAIAVYRRFLHDEDAGVALGQSYALRSRLAAPSASAAPSPAAAAPASARPTRPNRRPVAVAVGAGAAVLAALAIVVTVAVNRPHSSPCPTPSPVAVLPTPPPSCPPSPSLVPRPLTSRRA